MTCSVVGSGVAFGGHSELFLLQFSLCMHMQLLSPSTSIICILSPCKIVSLLRKGMVLNISSYFSQHLPD